MNRVRELWLMTCIEAKCRSRLNALPGAECLVDLTCMYEPSVHVEDDVGKPQRDFERNRGG